MKKKLSIICNLLIVIFELIAIITTLINEHSIAFEYFTIDSNILALFSSFIYLVYLIKNNEIPKYISLFKYITTINLAITFFVVICVLAPMYNFNYYYFLIKGNFIFEHLLCPIIAIISFIFFDKLSSFNIKENLIGLSFNIMYAIVLIILNILKIVNGPYPFLMVYNQSIFASITWCITIFLMAFSLAFLLKKLRGQ